ncbi:NADH-dependent flavin oxidoreductase [Desulfuromonas versatilis]|uniref:NADH-dependent flavin oxidoreductase n=1 Tax=Desulfuromonas versatilis TaxID=2802975 RepID=A0ABN6DXS9_9BACT|nr:NADH:flavin oxidoreductase [Desulfuromonas versatilis]BCR04938.1 NADH-dependent flavin oxidoreductase [Desulfuromonas versatilis]
MEKGGWWLFEETQINGMELKNRLIRSATWEGMADSDGCPTPGLIELYRDLAAGGVGLIVSGFAYVCTEGKPLPGAMGAHRDDFATAHRNLVQAVHAKGGKVCLQLGHAGGQTRSKLLGGMPLAPSAIKAAQYGDEPPRELTLGEIAKIVDAFAASARRARRWGYDAVQIHAAHGYLVNQFLSPLTNRRRDGYGGSMTRRFRFLLDIYDAIRGEVGPDYPVTLKLNASDNLEGGFALEEALILAKELSAKGLDLIEVSAGTRASGADGPVRMGINHPNKEAYNLVLARAVKKAVACPVALVGGIRSLWTARTLLRRDHIDFVSLARPLVCEPNLPERWRLPGEHSLSRCVSCNGCFKAALQGKLRCVAARAV